MACILDVESRENIKIYVRLVMLIKKPIHKVDNKETSREEKMLKEVSLVPERSRNKEGDW